MRINRHRPAQRVNDLKLACGIVQMIGTADYMGHAHVVIVHHHRQHISRRAVAAQKDHVVKLIVGEAHIAHHLVMHNRFAFVGGAQADHERRPRRRRCRISIAPAPVIAGGLAFRALLRTHLVQFFRRRVAAIGFAFGQQLLGDGAVPAGAGELINRLAIPIEAQPRHPFQNRIHRLGRGAFAVGILDAEQECAAGMFGIEPVEQRCSRAPDMQETGGRGRKTQDGFGILGHICLEGDGCSGRS